MDIEELTNRKSVSQAKDDNYAIGRAVLCGLAFKRELINEIFKGKLTNVDIDDLNRKRQECYYTRINEGEFNDIEIKRIKDKTSGIQMLLARIVYRICRVNIGEDNDDEIFNKIANTFQIAINIYNNEVELKQVIEKEYKNVIDILYYNGKYYTINNVNALKYNKIPVNKKQPNEYVLSEEDREKFYKEIDDKYDVNKDKRIEYAIACGKCHLGQVITCETYKNIFSKLKDFVDNHVCIPHRKRNEGIYQCKQCNLMVMRNIRHVCKDYNEIIFMQFIHTFHVYIIEDIRIELFLNDIYYSNIKPLLVNEITSFKKDKHYFIYCNKCTDVILIQADDSNDLNNKLENIKHKHICGEEQKVLSKPILCTKCFNFYNKNIDHKCYNTRKLACVYYDDKKYLIFYNALITTNIAVINA